MAGEETLVYWVLTAVFGVATLMFALFRYRKPSEGFVFTSNVLVSFITTISYVVMALALATTSAESGQPIYWSRWLFYAASCSMLTIDVAMLNQKSKTEMFEIAFLTGLTMFCGFLASAIVVQERFWFFGLSSAAYLGMLYILFCDNQKPKNSVVTWYVLATWSLFPLVWVVAPTGFGMLSTYMEAILYGLLDIVTKIVFGIYLAYRPNA